MARAILDPTRRLHHFRCNDKEEADHLPALDHLQCRGTRWYVRIAAGFLSGLVGPLSLSVTGKLVLLLPPKDYKKELNLSLPEDRKELLALGTLPTFTSIAEAVKAKRKELGIKNTTKFVERTKTNAPVVMPALTKTKLGGKGSGVFARGGKK